LSSRNENFLELNDFKNMALLSLIEKLHFR
jgi:hypothetical protein